MDTNNVAVENNGAGSVLLKKIVIVAILFGIIYWIDHMGLKGVDVDYPYSTNAAVAKQFNKSLKAAFKEAGADNYELFQTPKFEVWGYETSGGEKIHSCQAVGNSGVIYSVLSPVSTKGKEKVYRKFQLQATPLTCETDQLQGLIINAILLAHERDYYKVLDMMGYGKGGFLGMGMYECTYRGIHYSLVENPAVILFTVTMPDQPIARG